MVIRRIREHVDELNWVAVAVDFLIVVAGIVIGTQVNNWNADRIDRGRGVELRRRLISELTFNQRQYHQQWLYYREARQHGLAALAALQGNAPLGEPFLVDAYQTTQMDLTPPRHSVFDGIVASGLLGLVGEPRVQEMTSQYYLSQATDAPQLSEAPAYRDQLRSVMPYPVQAAVRARCGDRNVIVDGEVVGQMLPAECRLDLPPAAVADAVRPVRGAALEPALTRYLSALDQKINLLGGGAGDGSGSDRLLKALGARSLNPPT